MELYNFGESMLKDFLIVTCLYFVLVLVTVVLIVLFLVVSKHLLGLFADDQNEGP